MQRRGWGVDHLAGAGKAGVDNGPQFVYTFKASNARPTGPTAHARSTPMRLYLNTAATLAISAYDKYVRASVCPYFFLDCSASVCLPVCLLACVSVCV